VVIVKKYFTASFLRAIFVAASPSIVFGGGGGLMGAKVTQYHGKGRCFGKSEEVPKLDNK